MCSKMTIEFKRQIQGSLAKLGYQIQKLREPHPFVEQIDVFSYCMKELIARKGQTLKVLQVGANDGIRADPVFKFITDHRLNAFLLEPVPATFELLRRNYAAYPNAKLFCAALGETTGSLEMFVPSDALLAERYRVSGLCSANREQLVSELKLQGYADAEDHVRPIQVPAFSVRDFLSDHRITELDVIQIDTEGYDWRILSQFDLDALGVSLINLEFFHLGAVEQRDCLSKLGSHGFKIAHILGDLVAYRELEFRS